MLTKGLKKKNQYDFSLVLTKCFFFKQAVDAYNEEDLALRDEKMKKQNINLQNCLRSWVLKTCNSADHLLRANMIFIPMLMNDHYFCVVINFNTKTLQYLDNRKYGKDELKEYTDYALLMVSFLITILQELEDQRASMISSFLIEVVPFDWVTKLPNVDCGIFMMLHMMFFKGEKFTADFDKAMKRRVYRSSICATIVLHDLNDQRTQLLKNVRSFNKKRV